MKTNVDNKELQVQMQREVKTRVGKLSQSFINEQANRNPYSTHEFVEVGNRLIRALTHLVVKMRRFGENQNYLPIDGDTLDFDMKNLYGHQASGNTKFGWYLNVLELVGGDEKTYKYCGLVDIDITSEHSLEAIYHEVILELEYQRGTLKRNCEAWFTGKKGFRIGFLPSFGGGEEEEKPREPHEYMLFPLDLKKEFKCASRPDIKSELLRSMVDESIYVTGHGVKFDLMHHPDSKRLPVFLTGDTQTDLSKILGFYPTNTNELCLIGNFWVELFTTLEMILRKPADTIIPSSHRKDKYLTPRVHEVIDDSVVDPLVHIVPISERSEMQRVALEFMGDSLGSDPLKVLSTKFYIEVRCKKTHLNQRIKLISDSIMVVSFAIHKDDLVCPLHNRKHKRAGKVYAVYVKNALHFSIRCHSHPTATKEVRVPLFADQRLLTGFVQRTLDLVAPYTTTINAPYIGDMLVRDRRFSDKDAILLRSPMGSGKTVAISSLIKDMAERIESGGEEHMRLLVISTRRTCMMMLSEMFGVARYINSSNGVVRDDIHQMDKVVVSMESLHKLVPRGSVNIIKRFDLVILDECESILANFSSVTMKHKRKNYQLLKAIIETEGTKTVFSDAFLGEATVQFFLKSGLADSKKWSLIVNTHNKSTTRYELFTNQSSGFFVHEYEKAVLTKQRFIFASDRIDAITYFQDLLVTFLGHEELKKKKVLTITAGSAPEVIASASDCKSWENYDYIFYSPAVTVGNSYAPENLDKRFDLVFGLFTGTTTTLDAIQMTGRARCLKRGVAKILLTQTDVVNGAEYVGQKDEISKYIEDRINTASDELGNLLRADRNKMLTKVISDQIPGSQLVTDLTSSAESILVVPKETEIEKIRYDMPVSYLETVFTMNVINERMSKFTQLDHWSLYLSTTYLSFSIVRPPPSGALKKPVNSIMSTIMSEKKRYEERRRLAGDEYASDVILSATDLKKRKEEEKVISEVVTDEVNLRKIKNVLGKHISPALDQLIQKIQSGNVSEVRDLPINWDKLQLFLSSHVHVDCLERFYFFMRNIERPVEAIKNSELVGSMFKDTSEFIGRGSLILSHIKPLYDALMKDLLKAAYHLRKKTPWPEIPEWIEEDKNRQFVYLDLTAYFCSNTTTAYSLLCEFLNAKNAINEESIYYRSQPLKSSAGKNLKIAIEKIFSLYPEVGFPAAIGELQKLKLPSKTCSLLHLSISGLGLIMTKYFSGLFGSLFTKISYEKQKELGFTDTRRRHQNIRSLRLCFRDDLFENSKALSLLVFEDLMEFSPDYPFFDMIVQ